jgi:tetratricopeptide (TPR) repeat protein
MSTNGAPNSRWRWAAPLLLLVAALAVYAPALPGPYLWDDESLIAQNPTLDDARNLPRYFIEDLGHFNRDPREMGFYRPLQAVTFHLEVWLFGRRAPWQRLTNVLLHALAAIALWRLARTFFRDERHAVLAGLLFAVHPICTEQIALIANRGGALAGVLSLWTLVFLARAATGTRSARWWIAAGVTYLLGLLAKPEPLTLIAPALLWLWLQPLARRTRATLIAAAVIGGLAVSFAVWHWVILGISHAHKAVAPPLMERAAAIPGLGASVVGLILWPVRLRAIWSLDPQRYADWPTVVAAACLWVGLAVAAWRVRRRAPVFLFALVFFGAAFAPTAGLVPLIRRFAEHYYYLPAAAVCLALAGAYAHMPARRWTVVLPAVVVLAYAAGSLQRSHVWASPLRLWTDNTAKEAGSSEVWNNLGTTYLELNRPMDAGEAFNQALAWNPANPKARLNRAHLAIDTGQYEVALADLRVLLATEPCHERGLLQAGRLAVKAPGDAVAAFVQAHRQTHACAVVAWVGMGLAAGQRGRHDEAAEYFREFLDAAPNHPLAGSVRDARGRLSPPK